MKFLVALFVLIVCSSVFAQDHDHHHQAASSGCGAMEVWDYGMGMCMPFPMKDMPMSMTMIHGNAFFVQSSLAKPRGHDAFAAPNMVMVDTGTSVGDRHYVNLDFMGTLEKWTFPKEGYPELLQIGEENEDHVPYIDAQHPHSSPIMGLTLSDTIALGNEKDHLKISFAPRGEATEGPIAFMHRPTGMVNPDAPLGHHIGQDVGHITSTVVAASLGLGQWTAEFSMFNGREPEPTKVDLPLGPLNSYAVRLIRQMTPNYSLMVSRATVHDPEEHNPLLEELSRQSVSFYGKQEFGEGWTAHEALIYGQLTVEKEDPLNSYLAEFWLNREAQNIWGRLEYLQRTAGQLAIATGSPMDSKWVTALTLGYTHRIATVENLEYGLGASVTSDFLPSEFQEAYGSKNPLTGRVFLRVSGTKMWGN